MNNAVIKVQSLGKQYSLDKNGGYYSLRDYISDIPSRLFKRNKGEYLKNSFWALKDVSFQINKGDVLGVIGRNGAGKSTLLKILSRIVQPTTGQAIMHGKVASMLEIGTGFNSELSGRENIYLNGAILGMKRKEIDKKFKSIVDFSEIGKFLDMPVKKYSSGMYVRLAFSVAAHLDPEIVLLDEVLAVGDLPFQRKSLAKMRSIAKDEGRTVIFVSHNLASVDSLCNKALLLEEGKPIAFGKTKDVIAKYVASFKGEAGYSIYNNKDITDPCIYIKDFWINDEKGTINPHLRSGGTYYLNFIYTSPKPFKDEKIDVGFVISSLIEQPLLSNYLSYTKQEITSCNGKGRLRFGIQNLPLAEGEYKLNVNAIILRKDLVCSSNTRHITISSNNFQQKSSKTIQQRSPVLINGIWENLN